MSWEAFTAIFAAIFQGVIAFFKFESEEKKEKADTAVQSGEQYAQESKDTSQLEQAIRDNVDSASHKLP